MSVINTNITSLIAQQNLNGSKTDLTTAMERLSSGLRINAAKDDAAGQAIANRFSAQITGLNQAMRNANDGISIAQTAEGALDMINDNVQRIRELSVQAANDTNSPNDLQSIQDEITQRLAEIDRISEETDFNGTTVLGEDIQFGIQVGANDGQRIDIGMEEITSQTLSIGTFNVTGPAEVTRTDGTTAETVDFESGGNADISAENTAVERFYDETTSVTSAALGGVGTFETNLSTRLGGADVTVTAGQNVQMDDRGNLFAAVEITAADDAELENLAARGISLEGTGAANAETFYISLDPAEGELNAAETEIEFTLDAEMAFVDLARGSTTDPLETLDNAINQIDSLRSNLGAIQNRFADAISNLETNSINLSDARSRIEDADYAKEVANMTRAQILQQAGTSVLAQSNQIPQNVLSLLG